MDRPCLKSITCPGSDTPILNFSSEASDGLDFIFMGFGFWTPWDPGIPGWWAADSCLGPCVSLVSQSDAELCAVRNAQLCAWTPQVDIPPDEPPDVNDFPSTIINPCDLNPAACEPPAINTFTNTAQTCTMACPDGTLFSATTPAGSVVAQSQAIADNIAMQYACAEAKNKHLCFSKISGSLCSGTFGSKSFNIDGRTGPFTFSVVGGTLPTGVILAQTGPRTAQFVGVPAIGGDFAVTVRAQEASGAIGLHTYILHVLQITNGPIFAATVGTPFSETLNVIGGTGPYTFVVASGILPVGFTLSSAGVLSCANPAAEEFQDFSVTVTASDGSTCTQAFSIDITGSFWKELQWGKSFGGKIVITNGAGSGDFIPDNTKSDTFSGFANAPNASTDQTSVLNDASLTYNGPLVHCNLHVDFSLQWTFPETVSGSIDILYGLAGLAHWGVWPNPVGSYSVDIPFDIPDTGGVDVVITVTGQLIVGDLAAPDPENVTFSAKLTQI